MSQTYLAGIDIGTTGTKMALYDTRGRAIASAYREYGCTYPKPGWVDQDADLVVKNMMDACREAIEASDINPESIAAVSMSAQRSCTHFLDEEENLVRPMISWMDNRPIEEVEEIGKKVGADKFYESTGFPLNTTWILPKMMWLREKEPENWKKVRRVVQMHDYAFKAFGADEYYVDISDAGFYGFWDPFKLQWNEELLSLFDIDPALLPLPRASGEKIGVISEKAAEASGFAPGTLLIAGAGDQNSAAVGAGVVQEGYLSVTLGTSGNATTFLEKPLKDPNQKAMITNHPIYGTYEMEGYIASAAGVWRWFRDEIARKEHEEAKASGKDPFELLSELVAKTPAGAKGLVFLPYLASVTAPRWNPHARGTLTGLSFNHDRSCVARAFMEGITMQNYDLIHSMVESGISITNARIMGGPTKSPLWNQIQADIYNIPVETLQETEAGVLGAAIMAGKGAGVFSSIVEGVENMVHVDREYIPDKKNAEVYIDLYDVYCSLYEGLCAQDVFSKLAKIQDYLA